MPFHLGKADGYPHISDMFWMAYSVAA